MNVYSMFEREHAMPTSSTERYEGLGMPAHHVAFTGDKL